MQYTASDRKNIDNGMLDIIKLDQKGLRQAFDRALTFGGCRSRGSGGAFRRSVVTEKQATEVGQR